MSQRHSGAEKSFSLHHRNDRWSVLSLLLLAAVHRRYYQATTVKTSTTNMHNNLNGSGGRRQGISSVDFYRRVPKDLTEVGFVL